MVPNEDVFLNELQGQMLPSVTGIPHPPSNSFKFNKVVKDWIHLGFSPVELKKMDLFTALRLFFPPSPLIILQVLDGNFCSPLWFWHVRETKTNWISAIKVNRFSPVLYYWSMLIALIQSIRKKLVQELYALIKWISINLSNIVLSLFRIVVCQSPHFQLTAL